MLDRKITVVSNNTETLDGVQQYLRRVGACSVITSRLKEVATMAADADAVVLFADDYPRDAALRAFGELCELRPHAVLVVVTEDVESFAPRGRREGGNSHVVVLRRPAWGWMIIDAIRSGSTADVGSV